MPQNRGASFLDWKRWLAGERAGDRRAEGSYSESQSQSQEVSGRETQCLLPASWPSPQLLNDHDGGDDNDRTNDDGH